MIRFDPRFPVYVSYCMVVAYDTTRMCGAADSSPIQIDGRQV
jgi:hypothetical protein